MIPSMAAAPAPPVAPPPAWARVAAHVAVASTVPSSLWRVALAVGVPLGISERELLEDYHSPGWGTLYMIGLSVLVELAAYMTMGLVRPWGEVVPRWIPFIGGKGVRPWAAVIPAAVGAAIVTLLWWSQLAVMMFVTYEEPAPHGGYRALFYACYAPLLLWGPLLAAVTVSYHRRHRSGRRSAAR
ncbi:hypothetical protein [Nonomuraea sp. NPDC049400]|uniref:hypothetical protein n=1 Tax=Nonomuraea sp. NPDC049400 TaxID=3364352 RepID=UPI0037935B75